MYKINLRPSINYLITQNFRKPYMPNDSSEFSGSRTHDLVAMRRLLICSLFGVMLILHISCLFVLLQLAWGHVSPEEQVGT
jgi:hypothetical protein